MESVQKRKEKQSCSDKYGDGPLFQQSDMEVIADEKTTELPRSPVWQTGVLPGWTIGAKYLIVYINVVLPLLIYFFYLDRKYVYPLLN